MWIEVGGTACMCALAVAAGAVSGPVGVFARALAMVMALVLG